MNVSLSDGFVLGVPEARFMRFSSLDIYNRMMTSSTLTNVEKKNNSDLKMEKYLYVFNNQSDNSKKKTNSLKYFLTQLKQLKFASIILCA